MKKLIWLLLLASCFGQELKRPTVSGSAGSARVLGCSGTSFLTPSAGSLPLAYDAAGIATSSHAAVAGSFSRSSIWQYIQYLFKTWTAAGGAYTSLTLNVSSKSLGYLAQSSGRLGQACIAYSPDAGNTWHSIRCDSGAGWSQTTDSVKLAANQDLTKLQVAACLSGQGPPSLSSDAIGADDLTIFDIWTAGGTTPAAGGNGSTAGQPHRGVAIVN